MEEEEPFQEPGWQIIKVGDRASFRVPADLKFLEILGYGKFGHVAAFCKPDGSKIAVRKITDVFQDLYDARKIFQEIILLEALKHPNILAIHDLFPSEIPTFDDIYIVSELMATDLHRVIRSNQELTEDHHKYFCCQILCGLRYLHIAKVVHYDLKPVNLLVNQNCDLKITDFARARGVGSCVGSTDCELEENFVVCRWYSAPEKVLGASECSPSIDIWSVGCILCELIGRKPLFAGRDVVDQVKTICGIVGSPLDVDLQWLPENGKARRFLQRLEALPKRPWPSVYPLVSPCAHEALEALLTFNPLHRVDASAGLMLPYFESVYEQGQGHFVVNCQISAHENVQCTTLGGDLMGEFLVPQGEQPFGSWLAKRIKQTKPCMEGILSMINPDGEIFFSQPLEEDSEPLEEPVNWISNTPPLTKQQLQSGIYRECWRYRPWIVERDKQQLHELGIALP